MTWELFFFGTLITAFSVSLFNNVPIHVSTCSVVILCCFKSLRDSYPTLNGEITFFSVTSITILFAICQSGRRSCCTLKTFSVALMCELSIFRRWYINIFFCIECHIIKFWSVTWLMSDPGGFLSHDFVWHWYPPVSFRALHCASPHHATVVCGQLRRRRDVQGVAWPHTGLVCEGTTAGIFYGADQNNLGCIPVGFPENGDSLLRNGRAGGHQKLLPRRLFR